MALRQYRLIRNIDGALMEQVFSPTEPPFNGAYGDPSLYHWEFLELSAQQEMDYYVSLAAEQVNQRMDFSRQLIAEFSGENAVLGITVEQSIVLMQKVAPIIGALQVGALETALAAWSQVEPDDFLTAERIEHWATRIANELGVPVPQMIVVASTSNRGASLWKQFWS